MWASPVKSGITSLAGGMTRVLVPFEDISRYISKETATRVMPPENEVITEWTGLAHIDSADKPEEPKL